MLAILIHYVVYVIVAIDLARTFGNTVFMYLVCILLAPLGYYILALQVGKQLVLLKETVDGTFEGQ
jgi:hypothetical protein